MNKALIKGSTFNLPVTADDVREATPRDPHSCSFANAVCNIPGVVPGSAVVVLLDALDSDDEPLVRFDFQVYDGSCPSGIRNVQGVSRDYARARNVIDKTDGGGKEQSSLARMLENKPLVTPVEIVKSRAKRVDVEEHPITAKVRRAARNAGEQAAKKGITDTHAMIRMPVWVKGLLDDPENADLIEQITSAWVRGAQSGLRKGNRVSKAVPTPHASTSTQAKRDRRVGKRSGGFSEPVSGE